jgi:KDO2-lipid IV(A) lauroyltransferase
VGTGREAAGGEIVVNGATAELRRPLAAPANATASSIRRRAASFWLNLLFWHVGRGGRASSVFKPVLVRLAFQVSRAVRTGTAANAMRIFGAQTTKAQCKVFGLKVLGNFYDFVCDVGASRRRSREQLVAQIESITGHEHYFAARAAKKGAIIATAHMGSFEVGAAALLEHERAMHVVFKRDDSRFEQLRCELRRKLGVTEAPIDDGLGIWVRLRDALARDEVVMVQGDRVMPGQKGCNVPFLHGHLLLPSGPIKLALASGAPLIPVFTTRSHDGRICIHVEPAIWVSEDGSIDKALADFAAALEKHVRANPEQWLVLQKAFCEDAGDAGKAA